MDRHMEIICDNDTGAIFDMMYNLCTELFPRRKCRAWNKRVNDKYVYHMEYNLTQDEFEIVMSYFPGR